MKYVKKIKGVRNMEDRKFYGYPDIENSYQEGFIGKAIEYGYKDVPYLVTEKIHGSNSQISYDVSSKEFSYGTRSHYLEEDEKFYNLQTVLEPLQEKVARLADLIKLDIGKYGQRLLSVTVFGEVFGGLYPHEAVEKDSKAIKVQKGVYYSPHNHWMAFDIGYMVDGSERMFFLSGDTFVNYCFATQIDTVPILAITENLEQALNYPCDRNSVVFRKFGLPEIENNIMEGIVIRPDSMDVWLGQHRFILKKKNDKFKEKSRAKKNESPVELPEVVKQACEEISQYININRVNNVISHIGEVTAKDVGKVIMLTSQDVLNDYKKDYGTLNTLEKKDEKLVTKYMNGEVAKLVRDVVIFGKSEEPDSNT